MMGVLKKIGVRINPAEEYKIELWGKFNKGDKNEI